MQIEQLKQINKRKVSDVEKLKWAGRRYSPGVGCLAAAVAGK